VDPVTGLNGYQARKLAYGLNVGKDTPSPKDTVAEFVKLVTKLAQLFEKEDCSLCEVNPLIITKQGKVIAGDSKITFDDNAAGRHKEWDELLDKDEEDPVELEAKDAGLSYVSLDGDIGCLVNGAGLAMATMDLIQLHGGAPANFLDVGGGATRERVTVAFNLILANKNVRAILVNIFGGIVQCDMIAEGIIHAVQDVGVRVPVVVRIEGTNAEKGRQLLADSGLAIIAASDLTDAAEKVVAAAEAGIEEPASSEA
jgi:succinyl-CoA synthetase beta subunit